MFMMHRWIAFYGTQRILYGCISEHILAKIVKRFLIGQEVCLHHNLETESPVDGNLIYFLLNGKVCSVRTNKIYSLTL